MHTNLVFLGGSTGTARASFDGPIAPTDLLNLPLGLGEGGCGRPSKNVALLLAGRTDNFRGLIGGGGGWGRDTLGLLFFLLSSMRAVTLLRRQRQEIKLENILFCTKMVSGLESCWHYFAF